MLQLSIRQLVLNLLFALMFLVSGSAFAASYSIGGNVSGLGTGKSVTLLNKGGNALTRTVNGAFVFSTKIATGITYKVTVGTQPSGQKCSVANGSGTVGTANVTNVKVTCVNVYSVGGSISGLGSGKTVKLLNNGTNALTRSVNGVFTFSTKIATGGAYYVTVGVQPSGQLCTVTNGSGTMASANVTKVAVTCVNAYTIGGSLTGLASGKSVKLLNNGGNSLTRSVNGSFKFSKRIPLGGSYNVTVGTQPAGQTCRVTNGVGTNVTANVTNVSVKCGAAAKYTMIDIGDLGGDATWGAAINEFGDIAGSALTADGSKHAFMYTGGAMIDLGTLGGISSDAYGINNAGQVVGTIGYPENPNCFSEAFIYESGVMRALKPGYCDVGDEKERATANAINTQGWVALTQDDTWDLYGLLVANGEVVLRQPEASAVDVNEAGHVIFNDSYYYYYYVLDYDGSSVGSSPDFATRASAINNSDQVTGSSTFGPVDDSDDWPWRAFVYSNGTVTDLGTLGGTESDGTDINDLGQVVGSAKIPGDAESHAFLYSKATGMRDLNTLIPPIDSAGTYLRTARAINEAGMIVVNATNKRTYLLVPLIPNSN